MPSPRGSFAGAIEIAVELEAAEPRAHEERADRIGLYGVHMMGSGQYAFERPSITYLVGLAQGRGIEVEIPLGSPLFISDFNAGRYGQAGGRRF